MERARHLNPQVVLMDIGMPEADGYEAAARLRELPGMDGEARFMAMTGFGRPEDFARCAEAGSSGIW